MLIDNHYDRQPAAFLVCLLYHSYKFRVKLSSVKNKFLILPFLPFVSSHSHLHHYALAPIPNLPQKIAVLGSSWEKGEEREG